MKFHFPFAKRTSMFWVRYRVVFLFFFIKPPLPEGTHNGCCTSTVARLRKESYGEAKTVLQRCCLNVSFPTPISQKCWSTRPRSRDGGVPLISTTGFEPLAPVTLYHADRKMLSVIFFWRIAASHSIADSYES